MATQSVVTKVNVPRFRLRDISAVSSKNGAVPARRWNEMKFQTFRGNRNIRVNNEWLTNERLCGIGNERRYLTIRGIKPEG